jgi:hypothetical protein
VSSVALAAQPAWSVRAVLREGLASFKACYPWLVAIAALFAILPWALGALVQILRQHHHPLNHWLVTGLEIVFGTSRVLGIVAMASLLEAHRRGERTPLRDHMRRPLRSVASMLVLVLVMSLPSLAQSALSTTIAHGAGPLRGSNFRELGSVNFVLVGAFGLVRTYLAVIWWYAPLAVGLERTGPFGGLRRSAGLVAGRWWRTMVVLEACGGPFDILQYAWLFTMPRLAVLSLWIVSGLKVLVPYPSALLATSYLLVTEDEGRSGTPGVVTPQLAGHAP